jgi:hypothetical protein
MSGRTLAKPRHNTRNLVYVLRTSDASLVEVDLLRTERPVVGGPHAIHSLNELKPVPDYLVIVSRAWRHGSRFGHQLFLSRCLIHCRASRSRYANPKRRYRWTFSMYSTCPTIADPIAASSSTIRLRRIHCCCPSIRRGRKRLYAKQDFARETRGGGAGEKREWCSARRIFDDATGIGEEWESKLRRQHSASHTI